ncbi:hypothetical protein EDF70_11446 [Neorhizobium sp. JUb45]|nr:hypothetical protein EDF70_11446 [Neorhizobium sp. JUb45]
MIDLEENMEWTSGQLRRAIKAAGVALWTWNVDTDAFIMDLRGYELWDLGANGILSFEDLSAKIHPADRDRVRAAFVATRALVGPYEIDFRILSGLDVRWISARGQGSDDDIVARVMTGIFLDVTGRKQAEEGLLVSRCFSSISMNPPSGVTARRFRRSLYPPVLFSGR